MKKTVFQEVFMGNERYDFSAPKEYLTKDKAKLLYVSSATYGGDWLSTPHTHYCSELFYVIDGMGQFQVEDHIFPVSANDLVVINPNVSHTELGFNANPLKYIVLGIEGLELSVENHNANFCIVNFKEIKDTINFYLKMMLREIENRSPGHETICQDLMEILIVLFGRQTNFSTILSPANKKALGKGIYAATNASLYSFSYYQIGARRRLAVMRAGFETHIDGSLA